MSNWPLSAWKRSRAAGVRAHVEGKVGADMAGDGEGGLGEVGGDDLAGPGVAGDHDAEGADGTGSGDEDALAEQGAGAGGSVKADGEGFGKDGVFQWQVVRDGHGLLFGADEGFAEAALDVGKAHGAPIEVHVEAVPGNAAEAVGAVAAGSAGVDGDVVTGLHASDGGTDGGDDAGDLVTGDHGFFDADGAEAAILVVVQVGPADAPCPHANLDVGGAQGAVGDGGFADAEVSGGMDRYGLHGLSPLPASVAGRAGCRPCGGVGAWWDEAGGLHRGVHGGAVGGAGWLACAGVRGGYPEYGAVSVAAGGADGLCDGVGG